MARLPSPAPSSPAPVAPPVDIARLVERQVRAHYSLPPDVKIVVGTLRASEFANYDALTVTFVSSDKKQEFDFLLARDLQDAGAHNQVGSDQRPLCRGHEED